MAAFDKLRLSGIIVAVLALAGCEKSFDDRFADAEKKVREQASSIDKELAAKASEAAAVEALIPPRDAAGNDPQGGGGGAPSSAAPSR